MAELIGYAGSVFIAVSLLMSNVLRLRIINLVGAAVFVVYAVMINARAVFAVNLFIFFVDAWYIYQLKSRKDIFKFIEIGPADKLLKYFVSYNGKDIMLFFPRFGDEDLSGARCFLIMRNLMPVGAFVFKKEGARAKILLDYIISDYRDLKNARIFFNSAQMAEEFRDCAELYAVTDNESHAAYLGKLGFLPDEKTPNGFVKNLRP